MTGSLGSELAELIPLALVITLSPLSIIPGILMLLTPKPRPTSIAFLLGWVAGIAGLTAAFLAVWDASGGFNRVAAWAPYVRIAIGAALIAFGLYRWLTRTRPAHMPAWMRSMTSIGPGRAAVTAAVLAIVNPKVLLTCAAAGVAIGTAGMGAAASRAGVAVFTAVAASSVALPVLAYAVAGKKLDGPLARFKNRVEAQRAALVAVVLFVIGLVVLYKGIHGL
jgi:hypothetical protein